MAKVAAGAENVDQIRRFETLTGRANILKGCELSLKCAATGIRR